MKLFYPLLFVVAVMCAEVNAQAKQAVKTIIVKKDSTEQSIKNGTLSFLNGCTWEIDMNVNGQSVSAIYGDVKSLIQMAEHKKNGIYISKIKKKNPDRTFQYFPSCRIVVE